MSEETYFEKRLLAAGTIPRLTPGQDVVKRMALNSLMAAQSTPVAIMGEGGSGKSTVLRTVIQTLRSESKWLILGVTGDDTMAASPQVFWRELILPQLFRQLESVAPALAKELSVEPDNSGSLESRLDVIFYRLQQQPDLHPIVVWDDFDWVAQNPELDGPFFGFLRSLIHKDVTYLVASERPMETVLVFDAMTSPFFNVFRVLKLEPVERLS